MEVAILPVVHKGEKRKVEMGHLRQIASLETTLGSQIGGVAVCINILVALQRYIHNTHHPTYLLSIMSLVSRIQALLMPSAVYYAMYLECYGTKHHHPA